MNITKEDIINAVIALGPSSTVNYISARSIASYDINPDQSMTPEAVHNRNGGEPWKTKNKRGNR